MNGTTMIASNHPAIHSFTGHHFNYNNFERNHANGMHTSNHRARIKVATHRGIVRQRGTVIVHHVVAVEANIELFQQIHDDSRLTVPFVMSFGIGLFNRLAHVNGFEHGQRAWLGMRCGSLVEVVVVKTMVDGRHEVIVRAGLRPVRDDHRRRMVAIGQ